jgi:predicted alpha/beta-hydrolase family hydrolase
MTEPNVGPFEDTPSGAVPVRGYLHVPADSSNDGLALTHGVGVNCQSPLLVALANACCVSGLTVLRCDLPSRQLRSAEGSHAVAPGAHFPALHTPALFVHGTRDGFGTVAEMNAALKLIPARTQLLPVESAGHELMTAKNRSVLPEMIADAFVSFRRVRT